MKWTSGHLWSIQIAQNELENIFEYKFVIKDASNGKVMRWEEGLNHAYDFNKIINRMKQPEILKQIEEGKYDEIEVASEKDKIGYNKKTKVLIVHTLWQS